mmetsp:Transcript_10508/g.13322  ORF Transcript_10508/g.13322 Transcript_10508/m.13322 type:complete len:143 (+) Transcript_10508:151-579(+)
MLPLSLLKVAANSPMLVELKSGDTYNGRLINCDSWMNINLKDVICTSSDGTKFYKLPECYIRGSSVKYLRLPDDVVDKVPQDDGNKHRGYAGGRGRGEGGRGRGGRGRGEGGRGRGRGRNSGGRGTGGRGRGRGGRGQSSGN